MGFSRPEYLSEKSFPSPGDLPNTGIKSKALALESIFYNSKWSITFKNCKSLYCTPVTYIMSRLWFFQWSCMDVRFGLWRKLSAKKLMLLNCGVGKTLESPLDCKEIQPVHPKGDQSWVLIGRTDAEAETPILWPPDTKSWLIGKDPEAGRDWGQEEKGTTEDEMVGWYHQLNGHEFE